MEEEKRKIVVENEETRNRFVVLYDTMVDFWGSQVPEGSNLECVVFQDYKHFTEGGEYVEVPEPIKGIHVMPKNEFRTKFALVLDL